ncbi:MAG: hypothetical protein KDD82_12030 [Planctomycetes bacterium]|nr:hypothetical protein [Planctomycetota bacterium]
MELRPPALLIATLCLSACGGGPQPAAAPGSSGASEEGSAASSADPTRPASARTPTWDEPLLELLAGAQDEADLVELAPQLRELVPLRGPEDTVGLDRFEPGRIAREPLGAGWEALDFTLRGRGDFAGFMRALERVEQQTRRLVHVRRAVCAREGEELAWELEVRAYVQPSDPKEAGLARTALRRTASLVDGYVLRGWELSQLRAVTEDLTALWFERLELNPEGVSVSGRTQDPQAPATLLARLSGARFANRYAASLADEGEGFGLSLARQASPVLPGAEAAPDFLREALARDREEGAASDALLEALATLRRESDLGARLAAAALLAEEGEVKLGVSLVTEVLESSEGADCAEAILTYAHLKLAEGSPEAEGAARDLLLLAQSLQWPSFSEVAHDPALAAFRDDSTYLLDLLLAERDPSLSAAVRDPFARPAPPPPAPHPLEERLEELYRKGVQLLQDEQPDEARALFEVYEGALAELTEADPAAAEPWRIRLEELGEIGK